MTTKSNESLGRRIARMRLEHGMTQERLANIANVSAQAVSKWENDQSYPDILLLPTLAQTSGVSIDELLGAQPVEQEQTAVVAEVAEQEPMVAQAPVDVAGTAVAATPAPTPDPVAPAEVEPLVEPEAAPEFEPTSKPEPELSPEPEPTSEPEPEPGPVPNAAAALDIDQPATRIRIRVIRDEKDAVNLTIPLAAARLVANVASYFPARLVEGIDITSLSQSFQNAGKGTLIDVNDGPEHVLITLE